MDETTPETVVAPTFLEKITPSKKTLTRIVVVGGTLLGIIAAAALLKKIAIDEESDADYIILEVPVDNDSDSIAA